MTVSQMRDYISNAYPGDKWKQRCYCMSANQVMAIYYDMLRRKRDKQVKEQGFTVCKPQYPFPTSEEGGIQLTIFDALKEV